MEQNKPISHIVAGLIIGAVMIIYSLTLYFTNAMQNRALGWLGYLFMIIGIIIFINQYGKAKNNEVTFGNLFGYGFKTTAIIALVITIFSLIFFFAFPEFKTEILAAIRTGMEEQSSTTESQIDTAMNMMEKNFILFFIVFPALIYAFFGCIASLIGAAITKKKPASPFEQRSM